MKTQWAIGPKTGWTNGSDSGSCGSLYTDDYTTSNYGPDKDKLYWLETGMIYKQVYDKLKYHYRRKAR